MDAEKKDYFKVISTGFNEDAQREEIQINCGENGVLYLFKTDQGFIVDLYNQSDLVNSMGVIETDLEPDEEDDIENCPLCGGKLISTHSYVHDETHCENENCEYQLEN